MKYALPLIFVAGPAFAHAGDHLHPHDGMKWMLGLALLTIGLASYVAIWGRK